MTKKKYLIVIRGNSGSGKTTAADTLARKRRYIVLHYDHFEFDMQPGRPNTQVRHRIGEANMSACFSNALKEEENIILEGALVNINPKISNFDVLRYIARAKRKGYTTIFVHLRAKDSIVYKRMKKRGTVVSKTTYKKLVRALDALKMPEEEHVIVTDTLSPRQVVNKIDKLI